MAWKFLKPDPTCLDIEVQEFLELLAKMGNKPAAVMASISLYEPVNIIGNMGTARQPGESDAELRKRLGK